MYSPCQPAAVIGEAPSDRRLHSIRGVEVASHAAGTGREGGARSLLVCPRPPRACPLFARPAPRARYSLRWGGGEHLEAIQIARGASTRRGLKDQASAGRHPGCSAAGTCAPGGHSGGGAGEASGCGGYCAGGKFWRVLVPALLVRS